jgi:hypothetical protein
MKIIKTLIITAIAVFLVSCIDGPSRSPYIQVRKLAINSDTIKSTETPVPVGDTLQITMDLYGFADDLIYLNINTDREYAKDSIADQEEFLKYCEPLYTSVKEGTYSFVPGVKNMHLTLYLIAKRAKEDEKSKIPVSLSIKSACNTKEEYNPYYLNFSYYITNKK